jgi:hypothetical protein
VAKGNAFALIRSGVVGVLICLHSLIQRLVFSAGFEKLITPGVFGESCSRAERDEYYILSVYPPISFLLRETLCTPWFFFFYPYTYFFDFFDFAVKKSTDQVYPVEVG